MNANATPPAGSTPAGNGPADPSARRKRVMLRLSAALAVAGLAWGAWWAIYQRHYETTDNAYVQAPMVQITPQVGGTVLAVLADDTDLVKAGQPLVRFDPADARLAVQRAEAQLAQTVREVRTLYANDATLAAQVKLREAEVARVRADVARAQEDLGRRQPLAATGAVSGEELNHARSALDGARSALGAAQAALAAAREQLAANRALTEGTDIGRHPNVERAAAALREALLAQQRTELLAPVSGQIAKRTVQVGQRVPAGAPLMALVPLDQVWVEANFKEGQLREMRIGQPVTVHADMYGDRVEYRGRVAGLGAGTGASFALLPAQNATGNWIKVVQRVPVRIELEPQQVAEHPLRVGLSAEVRVDVGVQEGAPVASTAAAAGRASSTTTVLDADAAAADARVHEIIRSNLGREGGALARRGGTAAAVAGPAAAGGATVVAAVPAPATAH